MAEATDTDTTYPLPDDPRPIREQVADHPYLVVSMSAEWEAVGKSLEIHEWIYEWFTSDEAAKEFMDDLDEWAEEVASAGNGIAINARVRTSAPESPLLIKDTRVFGVRSARVKEAIVKVVKDDPDEHLFDKVKAPRKSAAKAREAKKSRLPKSLTKGVPDASTAPTGKGGKRLIQSRGAPNQNRKPGAPSAEITSKAKALRDKARKGAARRVA